MSTLEKLRTMTNATKANIIATVNAVLGLLIAFHLVLTEAQVGAIDAALNTLLGLFVVATYQSSAKRTPDAPAAK